MTLSNRYARRSLVCTAGILLLALLACRGDREVIEPADLVLRGGRVVTVDGSQPEAEAVAVRGAWIVAVGDDFTVEPFIGPETRVVELAGRLAIPGFIEGHGHFLGLGEALTVLDLTRATSWQAIVEQVEAAVARSSAGEWIVGRGWHQEKWETAPVPAVEGAPVHDSLSAVSPDNPVFLEHASGHAAFVNAKAMEASGLSDASTPPAGGELVRSADGRLTGLLRESAQRVVELAMREASRGRSAAAAEAERRRLVELAGHEALSKGVTSFHDAGAAFEVVDFFRRLEADGVLPIRLYVMLRGHSNEEMAAKLADYRMVAEGNDFLAVRSIKRQIDGALGSHGAWLLEPYEDLPDSVGLVLESEEEIRGTAELAIEHGFQLNTHAIGDRANRRVLDLYEQAFASRESAADPRWRIEHAQHLHPDDIPRFAGLGVIASMQAIHCTSDGPWVVKRLGGERARSGAYVWRRLLDSGAVVTNGTDVPVEDIDPIASFHASVTRRMKNGESFFAGQRMTRPEALRSYTLSNAFAAFEEELKGSLTVGKLADIVVLSHDILSVPDEEILNARVDLTIVGGQVRYRRPTATGPERTGV